MLVKSWHGDFSIFFQTKRKHFSAYFSGHVKFYTLFFSYSKVLRSTIEELGDGDVPCLLSTFLALGNNCGLALMPFQLISSSLSGNWRTEAPFAPFVKIRGR